MPAPDRDSAAEAHDMLPVDQSGARDLVGYRSSMLEETGGECTLLVEARHLNRLGLLHGGFVSMLLDNSCGVAVRNAIGDPDAAVVTIGLTVNFIAGAGGGRVTATGRVTGGGRSLKFAEAKLSHQDGRLLATATATFKIIHK
ncbi:PaaI family thioesterase [Arvimicrobium flavum]|uniref:PaaI family thioesterase n=1 Tax=Arvimicrobium flavum TaxID=3393320 RepID=UPI00237AF6CF|nr:PaaI family thioesterase [Mesorhizobium shangrilense]